MKRNTVVLSMGAIFFLLLIVSLLLLACGNDHAKTDVDTNHTSSDTLSTTGAQSKISFTSGSADINGIKMYYEIYGEGKPLVLVHGGGSTIQSNFAKIIPFLSLHRKVIGVELQAHGRTSDRGNPSSFEQDADDLAMLLQTLEIDSADFLGFSNGGHTTLQLAMRHPQLVKKMIIASAFYKRSGVPKQFWEMMKAGTFNDMPPVLKTEFLKVTHDSSKLKIMFDRDSKRMQQFKDFDEAKLHAIKAKTLIVNGNADVPTLEHIIEMNRLIPGSRVLITPGGHGEYLGDVFFQHTEKKVASFVLVVEDFLGE